MLVKGATGGSNFSYISWAQYQRESIVWVLGKVPVMVVNKTPLTLRWRHYGHDSVSNHQPHHCLLNILFGCRSKKTSKFRVTGVCEGNSPGTGEFPAQMASNAKNYSIWWRHHVLIHSPLVFVPTGPIDKSALVWITSLKQWWVISSTLICVQAWVCHRKFITK